MTTNRDWLFSLPLEEQYAWMNAEHQERALDGDTAALEAKIAELTAERDKLQEQLLIGWECECRLQAERDELKADHERIVQELVDANTRQCERTNELTAEHEFARQLDREATEFLQGKVDELRAERDNLAADLAKCEEERNEFADELLKATREREMYRKYFGKALDFADEIIGLGMEIDEGAA